MVPADGLVGKRGASASEGIRAAGRGLTSCTRYNGKMATRCTVVNCTRPAIGVRKSRNEGT